jgi:hypothetical protein
MQAFSFSLDGVTNVLLRSVLRTFSDAVFQLSLLEDASRLVWGHVVPDILDSCRQLVAALAETWAPR